MTTSVEALPQTPPASRKMAAVLNRWFYFGMTLLATAIVAYGFARRIEPRLLEGPPRPVILWVHSILFSLWMAFLIAQSALVRVRNITMHRTLGWGGAGLATAMTVVGVVTSVVMTRFELQYLNAHPLFALNGIHHDGLARMRLAAQLGSLWNIACFTALFWLSVYWRRKPELHRRLILLATCMLLAPAFSRFPQPFAHYSYYWVAAVILLGVARDLIVTQRVHRVYYCVLPILIVGQQFVEHTMLAEPAWWMRIASFIVR
ncbi:hypothetical protein [Edaphobacter bradus]|uniref:hypothetical protein n=1 Tax=Edaphobacter bradus TaxID=2259016 RepID=UPI0021E0A341|nr:hypothetical protein [Edaphobacter bradus]